MSEQNVTSDAIVKLPVLLYGSVQVTKPVTGELYAQTDVSNPIPSAPTSLVAVDAGLGDAINLSWISTASNFNVYKKVGIVYTKLNPNTLTEGTSYLAGGLTTDVPVDFVVRALNGIGQESGDSNIATATPTLATNTPRFTNPTYAVYVDSVYRADAILDSVELGFGSDLSTASFTLPVDPRETAPGLDKSVDVYINGRLLFRGYTTIKSDSIDSSGLAIKYTCHSTIINLTKNTIYSTDIYGTSTVFNVPDTTPETKIIIRNYRNVNQILTQLGISGGPSDYPGHVDITDQTTLAAAELVLSRIGNYRLYHDMSTGSTSVYRFGSNGFTLRQFQFSKNIISYQIDESSVDVVKKVTVIGAPTKVRRVVEITKPIAAKDPDGRMSLSFTITGNNIQDIQAFGHQKAKPTATFDEEIQVCQADFVGPGTSSDAFNQAFADTAFGWTSAKGEVLNKSNLRDLYPALTNIVVYRTMRTGLGAKIVYTDANHATVYLTECPKMWYYQSMRGSVNSATVGGRIVTFATYDTYGNTAKEDVFGRGETIEVEILLYYDFTTGAIEVEYTEDTPPPVVIAGSGTPAKTITDSQFEIINNLTSKGGSNNTGYMLAQMNARALAELAKHNTPTIGGSITIVGDETVDLRSAISIKGVPLEVSHVSHSFQNGYTTTVTLTNEPFVIGRVFMPFFYAPEKSSSTERSRKSMFIDTRSDTYMRLRKELSSGKDAPIEKWTPSSGKFAIYQD